MSICKSEWSRALYDFFSRKHTKHYVGRSNVYYCAKSGSKQYCLRNSFFRIFNCVSVSTSRFQSEEGPQSHGNSIGCSFAEWHIMYVPVCSVHITGEEEPTSGRDNQNWSNYTPNCYRTDLTSNGWATEVW